MTSTEEPVYKIRRSGRRIEFLMLIFVIKMKKDHPSYALVVSWIIYVL